MTSTDTNSTNTKDEVIYEVRKIKDDLARAFSYDIKKMLEEARIKQKASNRQIISPHLKKNA